MKVKKALADEIQEIFSIIYFINIFNRSKANRGLSKLLINPPVKINLFFFFLMIHRNKKERLSKVLTRLD